MSENNRKNWWEYKWDHDGEKSSYPWFGSLGDKSNWPTQNTDDKKWWENGQWGKNWWGKKDEESDSSDAQTTPEPTGYLESDAVKALRQQMEAQLGLKPGEYVSQWQPQINALTDQILNRKDFQYDLNADALYQMYKDRYVNLGQKAMMDTMGQATALTGGYGNSAAQMVGQQAYQGYLQGLTDKIPELYQIALDRYNQAGQDLYQKYGLVNTQEQNAYKQWQDNFNRWLAERDFATGRYDTERGFDYGIYRDTVGDAQWKEELALQQAQMQLQREQFELEKAIKIYEYMDGGSGGSGGGGGYSGSSTGTTNYGAGFKDAQTLINSAANTKSQENVIKNAAEKGLITKAGAKELNKLVGNTQYTK